MGNIDRVSIDRALIDKVLLGVYRGAVAAARETFREYGSKANYKAYCAAGNAVIAQAGTVCDRPWASSGLAEFFQSDTSVFQSWVGEAVLCAANWHNVPADFGGEPCDYTFLPDSFYAEYLPSVRTENARKVAFLIAAMTALVGTCALSYFTIAKTLRISYDAAIKAVDSLRRQKKATVSDFWRSGSGNVGEGFRIYELRDFSVDGEGFRKSVSETTLAGEKRQLLSLSTVLYEFDVAYWFGFCQAFSTPEEALMAATLRGRRELASLCQVIPQKRPVPLFATELREEEHLYVPVDEIAPDVFPELCGEIGEDSDLPPVSDITLSFIDARMPVRRLTAAPVHGRNRRARAWLKLHVRTGPTPGLL